MRACESSLVSALGPRRRVLSGIIAAGIVAACGGGPTGAGPVVPAATADAQPGEPTLPPFPSDEPSAPVDSGVTIRVVNVWTEPDGAGPTVLLRESGADDAAPLLEVPSGTVSEFVAVPKAEFGQRPLNLEVVPATADDSVTPLGVDSGESDPGDRITVIVHGEAQGDTTTMRVQPIWEAGEPAIGVPWPEVDPSAATLAVYPGALLIFGSETAVNLRTVAGDCLIEPDFGEPLEHGFGGTGTQFALLQPGRTDLIVSAHGAAGCGPIEPDLGQVVIEATAGQRLGLIPWGPTGAPEVLLLDMGVAS